MRASSYFSPEQSKRIQSAVADAEKRTSAEIVPAVATNSGRYDRAEDVAGVWVGVICMAVVWIALERTDGGGDWGGITGTWPLAALAGAVVGGFVFGAFAAQYIDPLRRMFIPRREMKESVRDAALRMFHDSRVHHTRTGCGVLIYASLFERTAAVIADRSVLDLLGQATLDKLCASLVQRLKSGDPADAFCTVIHDAATELEQVMPRHEDDENELGDVLIIVD